MSEHIRELTTLEHESVVGGVSLGYAALNPQPIPPGRGDWVFSGSLHLIIGPTPGCPGPLPPSPC
jgi:hypothetical protein